MVETTNEPKRRALGRGLESLLPTRPASSTQDAVPGDGKPRELAVGQIDRNPYQTRSQVNPEQLADLTRSISATGVVQPIIVRPLANGRFQLIAGERRWLASQQAGKATIPVIVRQVSDEQALEMTIVENLQRADLNAMEQARAYERLAREFHLTQEQVAQRTGKERSSVANYLRLLKLPDSVQGHVESGELSYGHARSLLALDAERVAAVAKVVLEHQLSVRQTETYVQELLDPESKASAKPKKTVQVDANVLDAQERLQRSLGLKVRIEDKKGRGRVIIEYSGIEDFDALLTALGGAE